MKDSMKSFIPAMSDSVRCRKASQNYAYVGIDFGTSNTVVSICEWDEIKDDISIKTLSFDRTATGTTTPLIPTVIYVEDDTIKIGQNAKHRGEIVGLSKRNYFSSFKMDLGYEGGAQYHQSELSRYSDKLESVADKISIFLGRKNLNIPKDSLKIDCPKKAAEVFLGELNNLIEAHCRVEYPEKTLKYSVSIPACFGSNQRRDYRQALENVGIKVDDRFFIDEPNAAFLSWLANDSTQKKPILGSEHGVKNVLVFDFGAGTCDLSILNVSSKAKSGLKLKNLALSRFSALGGDDLDREITRRYLFPFICEKNNIDPGLIPPHIYRQEIEPKLKACAERIKIRASNRLSRENVSANDRVVIQLDSPVAIEIPQKWHERFTGKGKNTITIPDEISLSFGEFETSINRFIDGSDPVVSDEKSSFNRFLNRLVWGETNNKQSIIDLLENVVTKAGIAKKQVDYLLFIGGSSNIRYVQDAVSDFFDDLPEIIIPDDLQTHVSKGVALHSYLSHGLQENPLTEILAEDIYLLVQGGEQLVFKAGTEIPASVAVGSLYKTSQRQREVDFPFLTGTEKRIVARVSTKLPTKVSDKDEITLEAEIDSHKIVHLRARYKGGILLDGEEISPFGQESLDEYNQIVGSLKAELNNAIAEEGFTVGNDSLYNNYEKFPQSTRVFIELYNLMDKQEDYNSCLSILEELCPDHYINLAYFALRVGDKDMRILYTKKAYEADPSDITAYNLAFLYPTKSSEHIYYLEESCRLGYPAAKLILSERLRDQDPRRARDLMADASTYYRSKLESNPEGLQHTDYVHIKRIASYEDDNELLKHVDEALKCRKSTNESQRREVNENKLLKSKRNSDIDHNMDNISSASDKKSDDDFLQI
jgi:molecular chaperone DnaK (HSP70)